MKIKVTLFKLSGALAAVELWEPPSDDLLATAYRYARTLDGKTTLKAIGPACMKFSKDFRRINGGPVLIEAQDPWGFPHLIM